MPVVCSACPLSNDLESLNFYSGSFCRSYIYLECEKKSQVLQKHNYQVIDDILYIMLYKNTINKGKT